MLIPHAALPLRSSFPSPLREKWGRGFIPGSWLECLRLAETADDAPSPSRYRELCTSRDPGLEVLAREAFLEAVERLGKRVLLLVDNLNDILAVIDDPDEQHRLRAYLLEESRICVVGTACTYFEAIENADQPLYNLFRVFRLDRFTREELREALVGMWNARAQAKGELPLPDDVNYWTGLHILTGGNPRLVKMIFQLLEQGVTQDFRAQLEGLLDAYTPYFKHRIESMSPQQRRVFDAIAMAWDPVHLGQIAPGLRMESNQVSAQVRSLIGAQLVAIAGGSPKRRTYQIADRFSNIYYFMRYSRAGRSRFEWFVLTMKAILSSEEYRRQLDIIREQALASSSDLDRQENIRLLASATRAMADGELRVREGRKSVEAFLTAEQEAALAYLLKDTATRETLGEERAAVEFLAGLPKELRSEIGYRPEDEWWWFGLADAAEKAAIWLVAEQAYRKMIDLDPSSATAWSFLGILLTDQMGRLEDGEKALRKAIAINPKYAFAWTRLGDLLERHCARYQEAEHAYREAIRFQPSNALSYFLLAFLLDVRLDRREEAKRAYRRAIELRKGYAVAEAYLARLLADSQPASMEAISLATDAAVTSPQLACSRLVFRQVAIQDPSAASRVLEALAQRLAGAPPVDQSGEDVEEEGVILYRFALDCIASLIWSERAEEAIRVIESAGAREVFDIPLQAIRVLEDPSAREKLASERLALVDAFLGQVRNDAPQRVEHNGSPTES